MQSALRWPCRRAEIAVLDIGISGAMAGYFLGWLGRLTTIYRRGEARKALVRSPNGVLQQPPEPMSAAFLVEARAAGETAAARQGGDMQVPCPLH